MLKKIPVSQLRVGMYLEEFCASWMEHPFWRSGFVIVDAKDIERLQASAVREVWIDCEKGCDVTPDKASISMSEAEASIADQIASIAEGKTGAANGASADYAAAARLCDEAKRLAADLFAQARMGKAIDADSAQQLVDNVFDAVAQNSYALLGLVRLKTVSDFTYMHSVAVCVLMVALARRMGFEQDQARAAGLGGLLHDIGKATMPFDVLHKPGRLDEHEYEIIRHHPNAGSRMLQDCGIGGPALDVCLNHHARFDGAGYPRLKGNDIGIYARMAAVCDVYDAVSSGRPYKAAWDPAKAVRKMAEWADGHFDQVVFHAFVKSIGIYPVGSLVRLTSGRLGVIIGQSAQSLLTPSVRTFFSMRANTRIPPEVVDLAAPGCDESIEAREDPDKWNFPDLVELWSGLRDQPW